MPPAFRSDLILHIEDDSDWRRIVSSQLSGSPLIQSAYGAKMKTVVSAALDERSPSSLEAEILRMEKKIGKGPAVVSVANAQVARRLLEDYLPRVIISDSSFPLNGKRVVEWIRAHGFEDYALIGLSGTPIGMLEPELKDWFAQGNARYFGKASYLKNDLIKQVIRNRRDNAATYGAQLPQ